MEDQLSTSPDKFDSSILIKTDNKAESCKETIENSPTIKQTVLPSSSYLNNELENNGESLESEYSNAIDTYANINGSLQRSDSQSSNKIPDWLNEDWRQHKKHIFVLSLAGKPIYSRYGDEDRQAALFGTLLTLSQFLQHTGIAQEHDYICHINAGFYKFVFLHKDHMILVAASSQNESPRVLSIQLEYIYNQILSILTLRQLKSVFEHRHNFDLRRLLYGADRFLEHLLDSMDEDLGLMLNAVRCLPLDNQLRNSISQIIVSHAKIKDLIFVILLTGKELIALVQLKKHLLHPADLHLLFNLIGASDVFKQVETWTPICFPKLDPNGFMHAHISYVDTANNMCLVLLSTNKDAFYAIAEASKNIREKLVQTGSLSTLTNTISKKGYKCSDTSVLAPLHFFYKLSSTCQYTSPQYDGVYAAEGERQKLLLLYQSIRSRMLSPHTPLSFLFHAGKEETVLARISSSFEFFIVFNPFVTKSLSISSMNRLLRWIKEEEDRLFILTTHTI